MKKQKLVLSVLTLMVVSMVLIACGNSGNSGAASVPATDGAATEAGAEQGPEYTSAYICPMHCAGSGSGAAGKCPTCGMDYVANAKHPSHSPGSHDGHDHGSHEGHDHGSHEGHNH